MLTFHSYYMIICILFGVGIAAKENFNYLTFGVGISLGFFSMIDLVNDTYKTPGLANYMFIFLFLLMTIELVNKKVEKLGIIALFIFCINCHFYY